MNNEDNKSTQLVLRFEHHHNRLGEIAWLARFLDGAIDRMATSLPNEDNYVQAQEQIISSLNMLGESLDPPQQVDSEQIRMCLKAWATPSAGSRFLIYSLCLVMLVTEIEIFYRPSYRRDPVDRAKAIERLSWREATQCSRSSRRERLRDRYDTRPQEGRKGSP